MLSRHSSNNTSVNRSGAGSFGVDTAVAASTARPSQAVSQRPLSSSGLQALTAARPPTQAQSGARPLSAGSGLSGPGSGVALSSHPSRSTAAPAGTWVAGLKAGSSDASTGAVLSEAPSRRPSEGAASADAGAASYGTSRAWSKTWSTDTPDLTQSEKSALWPSPSSIPSESNPDDPRWAEWRGKDGKKLDEMTIYFRRIQGINTEEEAQARLREINRETTEKLNEIWEKIGRGDYKSSKSQQSW